jgi:hypothetical protein
MATTPDPQKGSGTELPAISELAGLSDESRKGRDTKTPSERPQSGRLRTERAGQDYNRRG